jgi:uncharacterized protein (TIGR02246 family)
MRWSNYIVAILIVGVYFVPNQAAHKTDDPKEIKTVVNRLFETMQAGDTEALRQLFVAEGRLISTFNRNGKTTLRTLALDDFVKLVQETREPYRERMFKQEVRIEGDLATVWGPYDFHVGERLTNCGTNAVQLVRRDDVWKIVQITSTIHTEGCERAAGLR